jgi:hypothetical protein
MPNIADDDPPVQTSFIGRDHQPSWLQMWGKVVLFIAMGRMSFSGIISTTGKPKGNSRVYPNVQLYQLTGLRKQLEVGDFKLQSLIPCTKSGEV